METLRLGSVDLNNGTTTWIGRETDMGVPQVLTTSIARLLTDGEIVTGLRSGNRQLQIPVQIMASSRAAAVAIEAAIVAQVNEAYSPLLWEPTGGEPTVFDCFRGSVKRDWSILESRAGRISLTITIPALPFARTQLPVTLVPTATTPTVLDNFNAASGSRTITQDNTAQDGTIVYDPNVSTDGSSLKFANVYGATAPGLAGAAQLVSDMTFASQDLSDDAVVLIDTRLGLPDNDDQTIYSLTNGGFGIISKWTLTLRSAAGTATWVVDASPGTAPYTWQTVAWQIAADPDSSTGTFDQAAVTSALVMWQFGMTGPDFYSSVNFSCWRDRLVAQPSNGLNLTTASGTARLDGVLGTARTPVDLSVVTNAGTANRLLIARYPNHPGNFDPILSGVDGATTGPATADATAIAGTYRKVSGAQFIRYARAATSLDGTYTILGRLRGEYSGAGTSSLTVTAYISTDSTGAPQVVTRAFTTTDLPPVGGGGAWQLVTLGQLTLPPRDVPSNSTAIVNIDVTGDGQIRVDQLYLVDTAGDSVLIDTVTRSFSRWLLSAPDPSGHRGTVLAGTVADGSDFLAVTPWLTGQPILNLDPGTNLVLVVADKADSGVGVQVIYYPRYHSEVLP